MKTIHPVIETYSITAQVWPFNMAASPKNMTYFGFNNRTIDVLSSRNTYVNECGSNDLKSILKISSYSIEVMLIVSYRCLNTDIPLSTSSGSISSRFSRAHTIVGITFVQKGKNEAGKETAKTAVINLVDLAGR